MKAFLVTLRTSLPWLLIMMAMKVGEIIQLRNKSTLQCKIVRYFSRVTGFLTDRDAVIMPAQFQA